MMSMTVEIAEMQHLVDERDRVIFARNREIAAKDAEIERLKDYIARLELVCKAERVGMRVLLEGPGDKR
ncbi:MAG: hypothetical protein KAV00_01890 [Phycisphaerae bacterium]|nr:hypothetical protein [Phycisphaerae bacterium]